MANEEFEKKKKSRLEQAEEALACLDKLFAEDFKKVDAKIALLRSRQDRYFGKGRNGQTGQGRKGVSPAKDGSTQHRLSSDE